MNKYVIELQPNCKIVQQICESDGRLSIHSKWVDYLKKLDSDYINEHFGDLQNKAYQKGLEEGNDIGYKDGVNDGWNEAWEAAKKVVLNPDENGLDIQELNKIFNCATIQQVFRKYTVSEVITKLKACEEEQKVDNDKFKFGDEIIDVDGVRGCVVSKNNEEYDTMYALFDGCRVPQYVTKSYYRKTGRHFGIDKILEEIKE